MPLRSVEAATREDAIAAAREQFGPRARIIGVRRVRSGGVLGFFATERYVAEVEPDRRQRAASRPSSAVDREDADRSPDRSGDRSGDLAERAARLAAFLQAGEEPAAPAREDRVSEIADLLAGGPAQPAAATYSRTSFARDTGRPGVPAAPEAVPSLAAVLATPAGSTTSPPTTSFAAAAAEPYQRATFARAARTPTGPGTDLTPSAFLREEPADEPLPPSPFTAALARMVAGDRVVRQAVQDALDEQLARETARDAGPWTAETEPVAVPETSTGAQHHSSGAEHQEEKPVSELETTTGASDGQSMPTWAAQPSPATSTREEAIAQILRTALAQNHSDEVLADILRKLLADTSAEPQFPSGAATTPEPAPLPEPAPAAWSSAPDEPLWAPTGADEVLPGPDETAQAAQAQPRTEEHPPPALPPVRIDTTAPVEAMTGSVAEALPAESPAPVDIAPDEPIWAEVVLHEPAPGEASTAQPAPTAASLADAIRAQIIEAPAAEAPAAEAPAAEAPAAEAPAAEAPAAEEPVAETPVEEAWELPAEPAAEATEADPVTVAASSAETAADAVVEETAAAVEDAPATEVAEVSLPELARTASDPAPLPLDATTIMPPLSLLPPLPLSRRGGGRPPVPPPSRPATPPTDDEDRRARREEQLATVTRLPVAPVEQEAAEHEAAEHEAVEHEAVEHEAAEPVVTGVEAPPTEDIALDVTALDVTALDVTAADAPAGEEESLEIRDGSAEAEPADVSVTATAEIPLVPFPAGTHSPAEDFAPAWVDDEATAPEATAPEATAPEASVPEAPEPVAAEGADVVARLRALGMPDHVLGADFVRRAALQGTYAALTQALAARLPEAPQLPTGAGEVLFVVGPGVATLRTARAIAASLGLHPDCVQWASRGELAGLAPRNCRMTTIDAAIDRRQEAAGSGTVTIVAVDAPLRTDAYWMAQMLAVWAPVAVWAVVEATRKPEDMGPWLDELPRVDAVVLQDTDLSVDPAAVLERVSLPVALLDGVRATPHRWASLLCERLETDRT